MFSIGHFWNKAIHLVGGAGLSSSHFHLAVEMQSDVLNNRPRLTNVRNYFPLSLSEIKDDYLKELLHITPIYNKYPCNKYLQ